MAITLASTIKPGGDFPIVDSIDVKGGLKTINSSAGLNDIVDDLKEQGMLVYVLDEGLYYQYNSNNEWVEYSGNGGGILQVDELSDLDNIRTTSLKEGALCFVSDVQAYYSFVPDVNGGHWEHYKTGFIDDIVVSDTPPEDTSVIWLDTSADILAEDHYHKDLVHTMLLDIRDLLREVNKFKYMCENQINSGDFNNNTADTLGWVETPDQYIDDESSVILWDTPGFSMNLSDLPFIAMSGMKMEAFLLSVDTSTLSQPNVIDGQVSLRFFDDTYTVNKNGKDTKELRPEQNLKATGTELNGYDFNDEALSLTGSYQYVDIPDFDVNAEGVDLDDVSNHIRTAPLLFTAMVGWGKAFEYEVDNWEYNHGTLPIEPESSWTPNVTHICIKAGLKAEMQENKGKFLDNELLWCTDTKQLYIKTNGALKLITGGSGGDSGEGGGENGIMSNIDSLNISTYLNVAENASIGGTLEALNASINELMARRATISNVLSATSIEVNYLNLAGGQYQVRVDDNGSMQVYPWTDTRLSLPADATEGQPSGQMQIKYGGSAKTAPTGKLYLNSIFCGGLDTNEHSYRRCSHNYVEIANHDKIDKSMNGLTLAYTNTGDGSDWTFIELSGVIKAGSTYLIRGAQCSVMDSNYTTIKVKTYDIDCPTAKFSEEHASFYLFNGNENTFKSYTEAELKNPAKNVTSSGVSSIPIGYIETAGFRSGSNVPCAAYEGSQFDNLAKNRLLYKYYQFDPTSLADKLTTLSSRKNGSQWDYIDMDKANHPVLNIPDYGPKASNQGKNIYTMKTHFDTDKPNYVNCTFGRQATIPQSSYTEQVNGVEMTLTGATRCFTWISVGYYDEYIWIRKKGTTNWSETNIFNTTYQCGVLGTATAGKMASMDNQTSKYRAAAYNRIHMESVDGMNFTTHKAVIKDIKTKGVYEYCVGRSLDGYISEIFEFTVKSDEDLANTGFSFVQITDQQGFNWNEYEMHRMCINYIANKENDIDFTMNTGDMTQDGNRISEWLDYYKGREALKNIPEMPVIGNNDLGPGNLYALTEGADAEKINYYLYRWFYTFEIDEENPPMFTISDAAGNTVDAWVDSMYSYTYFNTHFICMNSEVVDNINGNVASCNVIIYGLSKGTQKLLMPHIRRWAYADMAKINQEKTASNKIKWRVAACHDAPFTLLTWATIRSYFTGYDSKNPDANIEWDKPKGTAGNRSGSHLNYEYNNKYWGESTAASPFYDPFNNFWFSRFCQETGIRLCIGGHKHTHAVQKPMYEQVTKDGIMNYQPVIPYTTATGLWSTYYTNMAADPNDATNTYKYPADIVKYPEWNPSVAIGQIQRAMSKWIPQSKITAPAYITCQATGYKHKSNKEMPCQYTPWEFLYVANSNNDPTQKTENTDENPAQARPYYVKYEFTGDGQILEYVSHPLTGLWTNDAKGSGFNFNKYPALSAVQEYAPKNLYPVTDSTAADLYKPIKLEYATLTECFNNLKQAVPYYASSDSYFDFETYADTMTPEVQ